MDYPDFTAADLHNWSYEQLAGGFKGLADTIRSLEDSIQTGPEEFALGDMTSEQVVRCGRAQDMIIREMTSRRDPEGVAADLSIDLDDLTRRLRA